MSSKGSPKLEPSSPSADESRIEADILVVDDEQGVRNGCRRVLEGCGARVELASGGTEAIARLLAEPFDVVVLDLKMPGTDGLAVLDALAEAGSQVVPVMMTAHASIETAVEAVKRGAFDYLPKPFVPMELVVRVQRAVAWRRLQQEAQRRLLELETDKSRLRTIVDSLADGVLVVNAADEVVMTNPAARLALGVLGWSGNPRPVAELVTVPELLEAILDARGKQPGTAITLTTELALPGKVYMARVVPLATPSGQPLGSATVLRDVTELTSLERAKSQFMNMVGHELKAPLAAVQGFLKVILSGQEMPPEKLRDIISRCSERVDGMIQLVRDLLDLSRSDAAPVRHIEPLDLPALVAEVVEQNEALASATGVRVTVNLPDPCPVLNADREDMARALTNLLSNAIKYNLPGGSVNISAHAEGSWLHISVADTGLGIPPDALDRLGEEFFRVNLPDRRGIVGTGLGLSLVKRVAEAHHGRLEVQSTLGQGSTFTLILPLSPPCPTAP